jgi:hypothetical protein
MKPRFETEGGATTYAPPSAMLRDADGDAFVWIRLRESGEITKAYKAGTV